jgi:hypothetical protein
MALKFLYITNDPFVNNSEEFVRILGIFNYPPGSANSQSVGTLIDPNGNGVTNYITWLQNITTSSTAYPVATSGTDRADIILIIPPGWKFANFGRAIAVQGSLEEVLRVS